MEENLARLLNSLQKLAYKPQRSICFVVTQPKPREVFAAEFTDRVVHHLLINEIQGIWEKHIFITDSYACRKAKGHHFGAARTAQFAKKNRWFGQFDISGFFSNINKIILYQIIQKTITGTKKPGWWKKEILWLTHIIIFADPTKNYYYKGSPKLKKLVAKGRSLFDSESLTGLPIGNFTSQFFANVYLDKLDQFAVKTLGFPAYARYVDDFILFNNSKEKIIGARAKIKTFLSKRLKLTLHPYKQTIQPTKHGIPFVGYFIKPDVVYCRRNVVKTLKNRIYRLNKNFAEHSTLPLFIKDFLDAAQASLNSYYGHLSKAQTFRLRKHLFENHLSPELKYYLKIANKNCSHIKKRKIFY